VTRVTHEPFCKTINIIQHINRTKDKNYMIISIDAEKNFDKNSLSFLNGRNLPQHNKGNIQQTYSKHLTKQGKTEIISSKVRNKTMVSILSILIQFSLEFLAKEIRQEKEIKQIPTGKKSNYPYL
jgi:hypothetical protein